MRFAPKGRRPVWRFRRQVPPDGDREGPDFADEEESSRY